MVLGDISTACLGEGRGRYKRAEEDREGEIKQSISNHQQQQQREQQQRSTALTSNNQQPSASYHSSPFTQPPTTTQPSASYHSPPSTQPPPTNPTFKMQFQTLLAILPTLISLTTAIPVEAAVQNTEDADKVCFFSACVGKSNGQAKCNVDRKWKAQFIHPLTPSLPHPVTRPLTHSPTPHPTSTKFQSKKEDNANNHTECINASAPTASTCFKAAHKPKSDMYDKIQCASVIMNMGGNSVSPPLLFSSPLFSTLPLLKTVLTSHPASCMQGLRRSISETDRLDMIPFLYPFFTTGVEFESVFSRRGGGGFICDGERAGSSFFGKLTYCF